MCQVKLPSSKRIAIVGGGIAGLATAYLLQRQAEGTDVEVVLFEEGSEAGGHALTVDVELAKTLPGQDTPVHVQVPVDVGFQVFNLTTYPHLVGFFEELGVTSQPSDMSFGCSMPLYSADKQSHDVFEWSSTRNLRTIFPDAASVLDSRRSDLLKDVVRFQKEAPVFLEEVQRGLHADMTVGDFLAKYNYSATFRDVYMLPMIAAIWSVPKVDSMVMPMRTLIRFMVNHHLHKIKNRPKWRTVVDRSRQYVRRVVQELRDVRLNAAVASVRNVDAPNDSQKVVVQLASGETELFDDVVLATHTDTTLKLLGESATAEEKTLLGKIKYQANRCVLHTDNSIMPANRALWASWNVKEFGQEQDANADGKPTPVCCSYWVNLLQNLDEGVQDVFVTLNPPHKLDNTLMEFNLAHPALNKDAVEAQEQLPTIQGKRNIYFAGAWTRYGFHEDGILSAVNVAELLAKAYEANGFEKAQLSTKLPWTPRSPSPIPPSRLAKACLGLFDTYAAKSVTVGTLKLLLPDGSERSYSGDLAKDKHTVVSKSLHQYHSVDLNAVTILLKIHDLSMFPRIVFGHSSIAMAESYMDHLFDITLEDRVTRRRFELKQYDANEKVDDRLAIFLYWCALNLNKIESNKNLLGGPAQWLGRQVKSFYHWQRQFNTIEQAKKHISMHYDLGNDLYELFLDKSMTYSSGMLPLGKQSFGATPDTLEQISANLEQEEELKIEHAFLAADIQDGHRVLEIGCGWGSMAIYATTHAQCRWTALTLSKEQKAMMEERVEAAGLSDRIEVLLTDFRELAQMPEYKGSFDRVVSLEMIEALGDGNLPGYFADINRFLKPNVGRVLIQAITIPDDRYEQYCKNTDFIKEYIFPGGHLPSRARIYWAIQEGNAQLSFDPNQTKSELTITEEVEFGRAYASTLRAWRLRMLRNRGAILALKDENSAHKYDARFMRMFEWYFAYCEVGFQQGLIHVMQLVVENKPLTSSLPLLPAALRANRNEKIRTKPFTRFESKLTTGTVSVPGLGKRDALVALLNLNDLYLSDLVKQRAYFSLNGTNVLSFHRADHFGDPKRTLKSAVLHLLQDELQLEAAEVEAQVGTVFLLTTIRSAGYAFSPVAVYYCMSFENPSDCLYVVLEVTSTPSMEKKCFVLKPSESVDTDGLVEVRFVKDSDAGRLFKADHAYTLRLNHPGSLMADSKAELHVELDVYEANKTSQQETELLNGKKMYSASLVAKSGSIQLKDLGSVCSLAITASRTQLALHWHALKQVYETSSAALVSRDLVEHALILIVALIGLATTEALKYGLENPTIGVASVGVALGLVVLLM